MPTERLAVDGTRLVPLGGRLLRSRFRMMYQGTAVATVVVDGGGRLVADPEVTAPGLLDGEDDAPRLAVVESRVRAAVEALPRSARGNNDAVREAARLGLRRALTRELGKRPALDIHLVRI